MVIGKPHYFFFLKLCFDDDDFITIIPDAEAPLE